MIERGAFMTAMTFLIVLVVVLLVWLGRSARKTIKAGEPLIDLSFSRNAVEIGVVMLLVAGVGACSALEKDTSVETQFGDRVTNLSLLGQQHNMLILFGFIGIVGAMLIIAGKVRS